MLCVKCKSNVNKSINVWTVECFLEYIYGLTFISKVIFLEKCIVYVFIMLTFKSCGTKGVLVGAFFNEKYSRE